MDKTNRTYLYRTALQVAILAVFVIWIYLPTLNGAFIWDDIFLITNWAVQSESLGGLASIWIEPEGIDYFPITYTALWMQWIAFGNNTFGYHVVNVLLHLSSCFLLWILLTRLKLPGAWLSALIFGIHPVCVESVAWISEIKNTLSLPFFLLTCFFWIKHDDLKNDSRMSRYYIFSLVMFIVAMLAKPSVVATPFLALIYEWWKRGKVSLLGLYRTIPLFLIAFVIGLITLSFQWERAIGDYILPIEGVASRFAVAGMAIVFYFFKVIWPMNLMPMYPQWSIKPLQFWQLLPWAGILAFGTLMWMNRSGWGRHAIFAAGFFLTMLLPTLGFLDFAFMYISWVSDHFLYVPMIGLIAAVVAAGTVFFQIQKIPIKLGGTMCMSFLIIACTWISHSYANHWRNEEALWTYTLKKNDSAWQAHLALGGIELSKGKTVSALKHLERAGNLKPNDVRVQLGFANALLDNGKPQKAATVLEEIYKTHECNARLIGTLVVAWVQTGQNSKAIKASEKILAASPGNSAVRLELARALHNSGDIESAKKEYRILLEIDKHNQEAQKGLAEVLLLEKRQD